MRSKRPKIRLKDKEKLLSTMAKRGYGVNSFAAALGISRATLSMILNSKRNPSPKVAIEILERLALSFDDIFFIESDYKK